MTKTQRIGLAASSCVIFLSCAMITFDRSSKPAPHDVDLAKNWVQSIVHGDMDTTENLMDSSIRQYSSEIVSRYVINPGGEFNEVRFLKDTDGYLEFLVVTDNTPRYPKWSLQYSTKNGKISKYEFDRLNPLNKRDETYAEVF